MSIVLSTTATELQYTKGGGLGRLFDDNDDGPRGADDDDDGKNVKRGEAKSKI